MVDAGDVRGILILAYAGITFCMIHYLLKYILAQYFNIFIFKFL
jgi:hypothetical protein